MRLFSFLLMVFVFTTLTELYLLIEVSNEIGWLNTIAWTILTGVAGSWLARHEGYRTLVTIRGEMSQMQMPTNALLDAGLILFSGGLLITPGFLTDAVGFSLLIPFTRAGYRKLLAKWVKAKFRFENFPAQSGFPNRQSEQQQWDNVVDGEILPADPTSAEYDVIDVEIDNE
jgi:UPF0716 protein FxsA